MTFALRGYHHHVSHTNLRLARSRPHQTYSWQASHVSLIATSAVDVMVRGKQLGPCLFVSKPHIVQFLFLGDFALPRKKPLQKSAEITQQNGMRRPTLQCRPQVHGKVTTKQLPFGPWLDGFRPTHPWQGCSRTCVGSARQRLGKRVLCRPWKLLCILSMRYNTFT